MVGSGKTTVGNQLVESLRVKGVDATLVSFRKLPCFAWLRSSSDRKQVNSQPRSEERVPGSVAVRGRAYRRKKLTPAAAVVYIVRIFAFRAYRLSWRSDRTYVLNRYFYDALAHYRIEKGIGRVYRRVVSALVPVPDLAILFVAEPDVIAARRPNYSGDYLSLVHEAYRELSSEFPYLIEMRTDPGEPVVEYLERIVTDKFSSTSRP